MHVAVGQDTDVSLGGAIKILGNYTTIRNSDLYLAGHWFIIVGQGGLNARGTIIERNRLSYASGLFYFCGSSRSIISNNLIYGVAVAAQNSAFATCVTHSIQAASRTCCLPAAQLLGQSQLCPGADST